MGRIVVAHPLASVGDAHWEHSGPLIDWMRVHYPDGFDGQGRAYLNGVHLPVAHWDYALGDDDEVSLVVLPGATVVLGAISIIKASWWASAIASAVVGAAASYAINALFGGRPSRPGRLAGQPDPSPTYSIGTPQVQARLNAPIPAQYGRCIAVPDLASQPYTYYSGNEQYLALLLCLGHGDFTIHDLLLSDTPAAQLKSGTFGYQVFGPTDHASTFGVIQAATGRYENVDTSLEVSEIELQPAGYQRLTGDLDASAGELVFDFPVVSDIEVGATMTLTNAAPNNGDWTIDTISSDRKTITVAETMSTAGTTLDESTDVEAAKSGDNLTITWAGEADLSSWVNAQITGNLDDGTPLGIDFDGYISEAGAGSLTVVTSTYVMPPDDPPMSFDAVTATISPAITADARILRTYNEAGPFVASAPGTETTTIGIDLVLPGGLYTVDDESGALLSAAVTATITLTPIDDDGTETGTATTQAWGRTANTNTPQRETVWVTVPPGRYNARVLRTSDKSGRAQDQSTVLWVGLKSILGATGGATVYGDVTLISVLIKASDGISTDAGSRISVDCTRKLGGVATVNPRDALQDLWTGTAYGAGRDLAELDGDALDAMEAAASGHNGFNARFDESVSVWDAMRAICRPVGWYPVPLGSLITLVADVAQETDTIALTEANTAGLTLGYQWDKPDEPDGFEVEYRDPTNGNPAYVTYPTGATHAERAVLFGCTSEYVASVEAEGLWRRRLYRRRRFEVQAELEGHLIEIGKRVSLTHTMLGGTVPAIVDAVDAQDEFHTTVRGFLYDARSYVP